MATTTASTSWTATAAHPRFECTRFGTFEVRQGSACEGQVQLLNKLLAMCFATATSATATTTTATATATTSWQPRRTSSWSPSCSCFQSSFARVKVWCENPDSVASSPAPTNWSTIVRGKLPASNARVVRSSTVPLCFPKEDVQCQCAAI